VALGQVFSENFGFFPPVNIHSVCFSTIIFTITRGWHNRSGVVAVPIASQTRIKKKNHWIGDWVGPSTYLDDLERRKIFPIPGLEALPLDLSLRCQSLYTDCAISAPSRKCKVKVKLFLSLIKHHVINKYGGREASD
jgi:hypothetical protein